MKHITNFYLRSLEQRQAFIFFDEVGKLIQQLNNEKFSHILEAYQEALETYRKTLEQASHDIIWTEQIAMEEQNSISLWKKLRKLTDSLMANAEKNMREPGKKLDGILNNCGGNPDKMSSARRTDVFSHLISRIKKEMTEDELTKIDAIKWVSELGRSNAHLTEMEKTRYEELADVFITRPNASSRKGAEKAYVEVAKFLNSMYIYLEDKRCGEIIDSINELIEKCKLKHQAPHPSTEDEDESADND